MSTPHRPSDTADDDSGPCITCQQVIDFIAEYLDGDLDAVQLHEFERHLAVCPSCVNYLRSYQTTVRLGKAAMQGPDQPAAGPFPEGLVRAIAAARRRGSAATDPPRVSLGPRSGPDR